MEFKLQNVRRDRQQNNTAIGDAVRKKLAFGAEQNRKRADKQNTQRGQYEAAGRGDINDQRKGFVRFFPIALSKCFGNQCTAAGSEHKTQGTEDHQKRHDEVHRGKRCFAHKIRHKEAVYNAINRGEDQHNDRRQCIAQQFFIRKVI